MWRKQFARDGTLRGVAGADGSTPRPGEDAAELAPRGEAPSMATAVQQSAAHDLVASSRGAPGVVTGQIARVERTLSESDLDSQPHRQFEKWLKEAIEAREAMPNAMALATSDTQGMPAVRMVLIDAFDADGFVFQTNLASPKANDLARNPRAAGTFFWSGLVRQVRVSGRVVQVSRAEALALFELLPDGIRAMLRACRRQGEVIPDRDALEHAFAEALASPDRGLPDHWGAFRLLPEWIEFFQARQNWLQDRLRYTRARDGTWRIQRLVP
jgi:pyridoxamine 5'-phosphate oxidase